MPMLLTHLKEDDISRLYLFDWAALPLNPTKTMGDDNGLTCWMSVPAGPRPGFKRDYASIRVPALIRRKQRIDADASTKPVCRSDH